MVRILDDRRRRCRRFISPKQDIAPYIYQGVLNGAFFAVLTSFAWPWILPRIIDRWMSRGEAGEAG